MLQIKRVNVKIKHHENQTKNTIPLQMISNTHFSFFKNYQMPPPHLHIALQGYFINGKQKKKKSQNKVLISL